MAQLQADSIYRVAPAALPAHLLVCNSTGAPVSQDSIHKALLAYHLNAHDMQGVGSAVFSLGSKLAHTCGSPNTQYKTYDGKGYHIALRDIAAGELLTTNYLDNRVHMLSTRMRRQVLDFKFGFQCICKRCCSPVDYMAYLPCPHCAPKVDTRKPDGTLPADIALGDRRPAGVLQFNANAAAAAASSSSAYGGSSSNSGGGDGSGSSQQAVLPWVCNKCGVQLPDSDEVLFSNDLSGQVYQSLTSKHSMFVTTTTSRSSSGGSNRGKGCLRVEDAVFEVLYDTDQALDDIPVADFRKTLTLIAMAGKTVGCEHGAMLYALVLHTEMLRGMMNGCSVAVRHRMAPVPMILKDLQYYVSEVEDNWQQMWAWLDSKPSLDGAGLLAQEYLDCAEDILNAGINCLPIMITAQGRRTLTTIQQLAAKLLDKVQPYLQIYSKWPLPEPFPLYERYTDALTLQSKLADRATGGSCRGAHSNIGTDASTSDSGTRSSEPNGGSSSGAAAQQALSMQDLLDSLPAGSTGSGGGSSGGAGSSQQGKKGKKGGKKKH